MSLLPEGLTATLDALVLSRPSVLFIRHAERGDVDPADPYADVDLTERGHEQARSLARRLPFRPSWTAVSSFLRCIKTADFLGAKATASDDRLGRPGPWVLDQEAGARLFAELGTEGVVRRQIAGTRWPFVRSLGEGTRLLLEAATERLSAGLEHGVCVSHDAVLMPAIAALTGERFEGTWLTPLDGFAIQYENGNLRCIWQGSSYEVPTW